MVMCAGSSYVQCEGFALLHDNLVGQTRHPEATVYNALDWLVLVFGRRVDQSQEILDNRRRPAVALKVDQRITAINSGQLRGLGRIVSEIVYIQG